MQKYGHCDSRDERLVMPVGSLDFRCHRQLLVPTLPQHLDSDTSHHFNPVRGRGRSGRMAECNRSVNSNARISMYSPPRICSVKRLIMTSRRRASGDQTKYSLSDHFGFACSLQVLTENAEPVPFMKKKLAAAPLRIVPC